ncbi:hypothetical protein C2S53_014064 [Perilla frutescens var. hirtella]|uniref:Pectinesterase inhibitor domain-containing protein n=1 Tax=Perilla frutescens var. hirtella TaxID=608512 RepID=A0AAD4IVZ5_PERFH|nr:hypothetical protein C2S53_014064 [Perilla frutescens var. hirtella]
MASLFRLSSLLTLAFLCSCHANLIHDICVKSAFISPSRCVKTLSSDPLSRGADLRTLGQIAIKKTIVAIKNTAKVARSLRNHNNTVAVDSCIETCRISILILKEVAKLMLKDFEERTKGDLPMKLLTVDFEVDTCEDVFEDGSVKGGRPAKLKKAGKITNGLMNVVRIIAEKLCEGERESAH